MYPIQNNVPKPKSVRAVQPSRRKYPINELEVGSMFFVPNKTRNTLTSHFSNTGRKLGRKFDTQLVYMRQTDEGWTLCEKDDEGAVLGVGVWRTA